MARIKLELPARQLATVKIAVRISDINYGNHVGNDSFVSIIHEARLLWLKQHGYTEMNFEGGGLIMSDIAVEFKSEVVYGDIIIVNLYAGKIARVSFDLYYELSVEREGKTLTAARAKTGMVCYNYLLKKSVSVPDKIRLLLSSLITSPGSKSSSLLQPAAPTFQTHFV